MLLHGKTVRSLVKTLGLTRSHVLVALDQINASLTPDESVMPYIRHNVEDVFNNFTLYYRYQGQNKFIAKHLVERSKKGLSSLVVSAPCSTGAEIFSVGCCVIVEHILQEVPYTEVRYLGIDGSAKALACVPNELKDECYFNDEGVYFNPGDILPACTETRKQNFVEGLGLKEEETPQVILMNNILYYLNRGPSRRLLVEALTKLDPDNGILLTTRDDLVHEENPANFRSFFKNCDFDKIQMDDLKGMTAFVKTGDQIEVFEVTNKGFARNHVGRESLQDLQSRKGVAGIRNGKLLSLPVRSSSAPRPNRDVVIGAI